jgi:hypothetical protein
MAARSPFHRCLNPPFRSEKELFYYNDFTAIPPQSSSAGSQDAKSALWGHERHVDAKAAANTPNSIIRAGTRSFAFRSGRRAAAKPHCSHAQPYAGSNHGMHFLA